LNKAQYAIRIHIQPVFIFYFLCVICFSSWQSAAFSVLALLIHELGHLVAAAMTGERINTIELTPYGGMIRFQNTSLKGIRGFAVAAGGPLANLCALLLLGSRLISDYLSPASARMFAASNCVMLVLNCMPALPLDGGRMLFAVGYYLFPVKYLVSFLSVIGMILGFAMFSLAYYGWMQFKQLNLSLVIIGVYVIFMAYVERTRIFVENAYTVIQEKRNDRRPIRRIKMYRVAPETAILELMHLIADANESVFLMEYESQQRILYESDIQYLMINSPYATIGKAVKDRNLLSL